MNNRNYNVFFHLHTVSGICISVLLYIIFFAGAFTLFEHSIHHWEEQAHEISSHQKSEIKQIDFDKLISTLKLEGYNLYGRGIYLTLEGEENQSVFISGSSEKEASEEAKKSIRLNVNTDTYKITKQSDHFSLGSLLYDLHFFYQLGRPGYYLSGLVAFFFLFAIVTGILIHWKKIISNLFIFRPWEKLKTVWTDAHTALGTVAIPFQFMYALTGAMFGLGILVALSGSVLYNGSQDKFYDAVYGEHKDSLGVRTQAVFALNKFQDSAITRWQGFAPKHIGILNNESTTMQFRIYGYVSSKAKFHNGGEIVYDVYTGKVDHEHSPYDVSYNDGLWSTVYRLHFADYGDLGALGNYLFKLAYFLLAISTCFVIISGVLIWLSARNKKSVPENEKRYNEKVGYIYLAICLSMFPVTAFSFIVSKLLPESVSEIREIILNSAFFGGWLILSVFFFFKKSNYFINKYTLLSGGLLGLCIPFISGFHSGNWVWNTFRHKQYDIFIIDMLWVVLSLLALYAVYRLKISAKNKKENAKNKTSVLLSQV